MDKKLRIDFGPTLEKLSVSLLSAYDKEPKLVSFMLGDDDEEDSEKTRVVSQIKLIEITDTPNLWRIKFSMLNNFGRMPDGIEDRLNVFAEYNTERMRGKILV
jgi:hypothetical protein